MVEAQAIGRALRLGQTREVTVIRYIIDQSVEQVLFPWWAIIAANTYLKNIVEFQRRKEKLSMFAFDASMQESPFSEKLRVCFDLIWSNFIMLTSSRSSDLFCISLDLLSVVSLAIFPVLWPSSLVVIQGLLVASEPDTRTWKLVTGCEQNFLIYGVCRLMVWMRIKECKQGQIQAMKLWIASCGYGQFCSTGIT
jgi:hypothetical protein